MSTPSRAVDGGARADPGADRAEKLSIVHVTTFYPPESFGGDGIQVRRLAGAQARRGHDVSVVTASGPFSLLSPDRGSGREASPQSAYPGVTVHRLGGVRALLEPFLVHQTSRPVLQRGALRRHLQPADGPGPDVIHYHNVSLVGGLGALALGDAVKLYTPHEYWLVCPTHMLFRYDREICRRRTCVRCTLHGGRPPQWWRYTGLRDRLVGEVDRFLFPSRLTRQVYREQGLDPPGSVLHHFLPDEYLERAAAAGERRPDAEPFFLYVGRLDAVKGIEALVEEFAAGEPPAPLKVVGEGPLGEALRRRHGDDPSVRFLGRLTGAELHDLYRDALALILPSAGYEVLGLVVLEAFAHGTPAIVTDVGGARELVEASDAGFVYGSPRGLHRALEQLAAGSRDELGRRGRQYVRRQHAEEAYVRRYEEIVREVREQ